MLFVGMSSAAITITPILHYNQSANTLSVSYQISGASNNIISLNYSDNISLVFKNFTVPLNASNSTVIFGTQSALKTYNTFIVNAPQVPHVNLTLGTTPGFNSISLTEASPQFPTINATFKVQAIPKINANITLNCTSTPYINTPYNVVVRPQGCSAVNQNLTFRPNVTIQHFVNTAENEIITVNAIPKWNIFFNCTSSFTGNKTIISNATVNALLECNTEPPLKLEYNITPNNATFITTNVFGKNVSEYGTFVNDTIHGIKINAFYPRQNKNVLLLPADQYNISAANLTVKALNFSSINTTLENKLYFEKYGHSCADSVNVSNTFLCLQQTNSSPNIDTICPQTFLLTKNLSLGLAGCVIYNYNASRQQVFAEQPFVSTQEYPDNVIAALNTRITDLTNVPQYYIATIGGVAAVVCVAIIAFAYLVTHNKSIMRK